MFCLDIGMILCFSLHFFFFAMAMNGCNTIE